MNNIIVDLSNFRDTTGARVEPGRYRVVVEDVDVTTSNAGNPMVNLWLRIISPAEFNGSTLVDRLTLTEKAMFRVVNFLQALGMPTPRKRIQINPRKFIGHTLDVDVDDGDPYRGNIRSEVRGYIRVPKKRAEEQDTDAEDLTDEAEETEIEATEPEPAPKQRTRRAAKKPDPEPQPTLDENEDEDEDSIDLEELEELDL